MSYSPNASSNLRSSVITEIIDSFLSLLKNNHRMILNRSNTEEITLIAYACMKDLDKFTVMAYFSVRDRK